MINVYDYKVAHPDIFKQFAVKDILFLHYICPQVDKQLKLFTHYNEIAFTLSGKKTFYQGGKSWTITDNQSLFFRKTAFKQEMYEYVGWEVLAFYFQDDFLRQIFKEYRKYLPLKNLPSPPTDMVIEIKVNETIRAFCYSIVPYFTQKLPPAEGLLELKFKELLFNIFSDSSNADLLAYVNSIQDQHKTPLWEVMEANYMFNLTIVEYARIAQRSVASFKREFREYYHTTPGKWLTHKRLEHAKLLLTTSKKNISEIAYDSGFENISHFSRIFKEKYGASPLQYRNKQF
jgi:AraC-like DNA-binding protein